MAYPFAYVDEILILINMSPLNGIKTFKSLRVHDLFLLISVFYNNGFHALSLCMSAPW